MYIKIHNSYRLVVAICDSDILGKKFEEGKMQLDVRENFYKGNDVSENEAIKIMQVQKREDATFNIVGKNSISAALKAGIISEEAVGHVSKIPFALVLL